MWFVDAAFALAAPCVPMQVVAYLPADGATDVPVDVVPTVVVDTSCGVRDLYVVLRDPFGTELDLSLPAAALDPETSPNVVELDPGVDLDPNTRYTLEFSPGGGRGDAEFTTGDGPAPPFDGVPDLEVLDALRAKGLDGQLVADVRILPAADGHLVTVSAGDGPVAAFTAVGPDPFDAQISWPKRGDGRRFCLTVQERDLAGSWSDPSEEVCDRARGCGCNQGRAPGLFVLGVVGLLLRRRRA